MSHLKESIAKARAEGRTKDAEAMERIEAEERRKKAQKFRSRVMWSGKGARRRPFLREDQTKGPLD